MDNIMLDNFHLEPLVFGVFQVRFSEWDEQLVSRSLSLVLNITPISGRPSKGLKGQ